MTLSGRINSYLIQAAFDLQHKIDRIQQAFGDKLRAKDKREFPMAPTDVPDIVEDLSRFDPTPNKEYLFWICKLYANDGIRRFEDVGARVKPGLETYIKLKNTKRIPIEDRDINKFKNISDFEDLLEKYQEVDTTSGTAADKAMEQQFYKSGDAVLLHNDVQVKVVIPKTKAASMYFGRNTRWCTSAKNDNMFDDYDADGPLYIVLIKKENKRYQLHPDSDSFMDEKDKPFDVRALFTKYPVLYDIFYKKATKLNVVVMLQHPTESQCFNAIKRNPTIIDSMPNASDRLKLFAIELRPLTILKMKNPTVEMQFIAARGTLLRGEAQELMEGQPTLLSKITDKRIIEWWERYCHHLDDESDPTPLLILRKNAIAELDRITKSL